MIMNQRATNFGRMHSSFLTSVKAVEFQMRKTCYNLRVNRTKYHNNI